MEIQFRTETNKLRNTSNEMKDKECTDKERTLTELTVFNNNMVVLKEEVTQLNETQKKVH